MQVLVVIRRRSEAFPAEAFAEMLGPEAVRVKELYAAGTIREIFSRGDVLGAVLRLEVDDEAAAQAVIASLPLHQRGMLDVQMIVPLKPYRGFAPEAV